MIERQKVVRTFDVFCEDTVRIRWFLPKEGGYYEEEYVIPPLETRKARENDRLHGDAERVPPEV